MSKKTTHAEIRMYRMGTGDCFAIKLFAGTDVTCRILVDAGCWSGSKDHLQKYIKDLKTYLDNFADILIVTHEHKDHVHAFDVCEELFTDDQFNVDEIWMGWTENDRVKKVKDWKEDYGEKKKALGIASLKLAETMESAAYKKQFEGSKDAAKMLGARQTFTKVLNGFAELHMSVDAEQRSIKEVLPEWMWSKKRSRKKRSNISNPVM